MSQTKNDEVVYHKDNEFPDTLRDFKKAMDNPKLNKILYENKKENNADGLNDSIKILEGKKLPPKYGTLKSMKIDKSNIGENTKLKTKIIIGNKRNSHQMSHNQISLFDK